MEGKENSSSLFNENSQRVHEISKLKEDIKARLEKER
jgi:hypothetical protein